MINKCCKENSVVLHPPKPGKGFVCKVCKETFKKHPSTLSESLNQVGMAFGELRSNVVSEFAKVFKKR